MPEPLDFEAVRDNPDSDRWARADPTSATLAQLRWETWGIHLPDGEDAHIVHLRRETGAYLGDCDCKGWEFSDGPCAHLCTLRKAAVIGVEDVAGRRVQIANRDQARADQAVEEVLADGGQHR